MAANGLEIANAWVALQVRMPGVQKTITQALGGAGVDSALRAQGSKWGGVLTGAIGGGVALALGKVVGKVTSSIDSAIKRVDTMNNFPKIMKNLGYSADDATASIDKMSTKLTGLPTALDQMAGAVQQLAPLTGSLEKATDLSLALNNAILAGGKSTVIQTNAMDQYVQMLSVGEVDLAAWKSLITAMPGQLDQLSQSLLGAGKNSFDLYDALKGGDVTFDQFNDAILKLNDEGLAGYASFAEQAKDATNGIETSQANLNTAVTRGMANLINKVAPQITKALAGVTDFANKAFKGVGGLFDLFVNGEYTTALRDAFGWEEDSKAVDFLFRLRDGAQGLYDLLIKGDFTGKLREVFGWDEDSPIVGLMLDVRKFFTDLPKNLRATWEWLVKNKDLVSTLVAVIGGAAIGWKAYTTAVNIAKAAQMAFNTVMNLNPIGLIIAGIAALVAGLTWFFTQTETGQKIWKGFTDGLVSAWKWVTSAFDTGAKAIGGFFSWLWNDKIKPVTDFIGAAFQVMWFGFIKPAWDGLQSGLKSGWAWLDQWVFQPFKNGVDLIGKAFEKTGKFIGDTWSGIKKAAASPINFVLDTVYNNGVRKFWNGVAGSLGLDGLKLPQAQTIAFASGGVLPGWSPGRDIHEFWSATGGRLRLSGGEAIMRPEFTRAVGGKSGIDRLNALATGGQLNKGKFGFNDFASGGVYEPDGKKPWYARLLDAGIDVWNGLGDFFGDPLEAIKKWVIDGIIKPLIPTSGSVFARGFGHLPIGLMEGIGKKAAKTFSEHSREGGGSFAGGNTLKRVQALLGGSGLAITSTYRSPAENARVGGHPQSLHIDRVNPAVDVAGSIANMNRFALRLANMGGWRQLFYNNVSHPNIGWRPGHEDHVHIAKNGGVFGQLPKLYDSGGWIPHGGLALNLSGRPEAVLNPDQSRAFAAGGWGIRPGDRVVFEVEGTPFTAIAKRVVREEAPTSTELRSRFGT